MLTKILKLFVSVGLLFFSYTSYGQLPAFTIQNVKGACEGFSNGSVEVLVSSATGSVSIFYFGPAVGGPFAATVGVPFPIAGLASSGVPYLIVVQDTNGAANANVTILSYPTLLTGTVDTVVPNTDCNISNGSISITPLGGSGPPNYTFSWTGPNGFTSTSEDISGLLGGNYSVTISDINSNCTETLPPIAVSNPSPVLFNITTPPSINVCTGSDWVLSLSGSELGATYEVYRNNVTATGIIEPGTGGALNFTIPFGTYAAGDNFKITATNGICSGDMNGVVVANIVPLPTAVTSGGGTVCSGSPLPSVTFTFTGTAPFDFTYSDGVTPVVVNNHATNSFVLNPAPAAGTYSVTDLSDANGCIATNLGGSVQVIVNPSPTSAILSGTASVCLGSSTNLIVTITSGTGPFSITLDNGVGTINNYVSGAPIPVSPGVTTTYNMVGNVVDANGCTVAGSGSATVTVNTPPTSAVLSGAATICSGSSTNLVVTITGGASPYTITIDNGVGTINNYVSGTPIPVSPAATTTYAIVGNVTDANGCSVAGSGTALVTVNPSPTSAVLSGTATICVAESTDLIVTITSGTGPFSITIDNGVGTINNYVSGTPIPVSPGVTTTYNMVGNVVDANGCTVAGSGSATITVNTPPTSAVLSGAATICSGSSTNLIVTITGGTSPYTVTIDNGVGTINNYVSGTPIPVSPAATTTYAIVGNVTDANGCGVAGSGTALVTVNPSPTSAVLSGTATICLGSSTNLIVTITSGTGPFSITLDNGIGTINNYVSGTPIPVNPGVMTTYNMVGNVVDANGCSVAGSGSATITVNPGPTSAVLSGVATICSGSSTNLIVTITGGTSPYTVTIDNGVGTINNYVSGTPIPVSPAATTTYAIVGNVTDANGCGVAGSGTALVTVNPSPTSAVLSGTATICLAESTDLIVTITSGTGPFSITIDNGVGTINNYVSGTPIPVNPGVTTTYNMVGNVVDANGCSVAGSGSATITVNPGPTSAVLSGAATICSGSSTNLIVTITGGTSPYTVTIDNGVGTINNYVSGTPIPVSPVATTTYAIVGNVTDANGCGVAGSGTALVTVNPSPTSAVLSGTATICVGESADLIVTITSGTGPFSITLDNGIGTINNYVSGTPIPVNPGATTTYNMVGNVVDASGCSVAGSGSATITVNPGPTSAVLSGAATICSGSSTDLIVTITGGTGPYTVTIDNGVGTINNYVSGSPIPVSPVATTTYAIVGNVTDASGCFVAGSGSALVTVNPAPTSAVISGTATICSGISTDLIVTITGGAGPYTVTINNGVGTLNNYVSGTPIPVSPGVTTVYSIVGNVTDASGCTVAGSGSATITVTPSPTATISGTTAICNGSSTDLTVTFTGTGPWSFQYSDGTTTSAVIPSGFSIFTIPVSPTVTTTYTIVNVSDASVCPGTVSGGPAIVTVNQNPLTNLTVDVTLDPLCSGGISDVTVANSELGVSYQLRNDVGDVLIGAPVIGTGATINLPTGVLLATTTFNVLATAAGCTPVELTNLATVNVSGAINAGLSVAALVNPLCAGNSTDIQITSSENGVLYQLRDDADNSLIGAAVAGNGGTINLPTGNLAATTTFNVLATNGACSIELTDLETVTVSPAPDASLAVAVTLDPLCVGGATTITVASSEVGITYQLRDDADDSAVGSPVVGTGATISLPTGVLNITTTFNILATGAGCPPVELTNLAIVNVSGIIDATLTIVAAASPICEGSGTNIQIANSEVGVDYQLRDDATDNPVGAPVAGTGLTILLPTGNLAATTTFNVLATNGACFIELTDLETVNIDVAPDPSLVVDVTLDPLCIGGISAVTVDLSQVGVTYQLRNDADDSAVGGAVVGTGGTISLSTGVLNATTVFNILATSGVCPPVELTTLATVNVAGTLDASLTVTTSGSPICAGTSTFIQVQGSEVGVDYQLRDDLNDANIGAPVAGTGGTINLPTGNISITTTFNVVASNVTCSIELTDQETITISPSPAINVSVTAGSALICSGVATNIIVASESGVSYQLRNNAGNVAIGSPVVGTGGNILLPTGNLAANTTFNVLATVGSCSAQLTATATVTIRPLGDPACGGGGSDCTNFSLIQPTIITQPSCNNLDVGEVSITIARADGTPTLFSVAWTIGGNTQTASSSNTVSFDDLSSGLYQYTVTDLGNGRTCGPFDFFLDLQTEVEILDKQVTSNVTCFGGTDGNVILSVDGSSTGEYWYKYVLDGVESAGQTFTPGAPLPGGLPADDDDFLIIKVDDSFAFTCPDTVMVRIRHTFSRIDFTVAATDVTTCNGTDGAIQVASIGGGDSGSNPLQIRLKKAVPFITDPSGYIVLVDYEDVVAGFKEYTTLSQGNYVVDVKDHLDCVRSQPIAVQAPGQVPLSSVSIITTDASCLNDGASGSIQVTISDAGLFEVALSQDQVNVPADDEFVDYSSPSLPSITFNNVTSGIYYLYFKSSTTTCPTRTDAVAIGGVQAVGSFDVLSSCENPNLTINNITGQQNAPFVIRVFRNSDKFFKIDSLTAPGIPLSNSVSFVYNPPLQHSFLALPDTYRFVMVQTQTTGAGTCTLASDTVVYNVRLGLGIVLGAVTPSYPEPKRTGSIEIADIDGGTRFISPQNELYYEISLYDADDDIVIFDWTEVKLNPQNKFSKLYEYLPPGVYRIRVRDAAGCEKTLDAEITLDPRVFVPNIFTPNDDAVNDQFEVLNLPLVGAHRLIISNRWGNQVFESKDYREGNFWSGGEEADGIYFYRLQVEGGDTYTGWVEILRGTRP